MKKRIFLLLAVLLCLTLAVALASCNDDGTACQHRDADDNALCDKCGENYTDGTDYTVTFVTNGGNAIAMTSLQYGAALSTPVREGYTFGGWFTDIELTTAITTVPTSDIIVYAYWAEENKPSDFFYYGNEGITIKLYWASDASSVSIPAYIGGKPVITIGDNAFSYCTNLASIVIPEGVTTIGNSAFVGCTSLASIVIPEGVTTIGNSAFEACTSLASIVIPEGVTTIGDSAFEACTSLASIVIPEGLTAIGYEAFYNCTSLASVTFGENSQLTTIDNYAFYDCTSLASIIIPASVTTIGSSAFSGCTSLASFTIPDGVMSIGAYAFYNCVRLTSVIFENTAGWWRASSSTATSGTTISASILANTDTMARYLTSMHSYYNSYWKRG